MALLAIVAIAGIGLLATDAGRALVVRALPLYAPHSGLTVAAGRIEGSLFGRLRIRDLALGDAGGVFAVVPAVDLDWRPLDLFGDRLTVRSATAATATLLRWPRLRPSADRRLLPDIDIVVGRLRIDRLRLPGSAQVVRVAGSSDVRRGRAHVDLSADAIAGADTARVRLDAEPDRDRFDLAARVAAPAGGVIARLLGLARPLDLVVAGDGRWRAWRGTAVARLGGARVADLALDAAAGRFVVAGTVAPFAGGVGARLAGPATAVRAEARLAARVLTGRFVATSPAMAVTADGTLDFADERPAVAVRARLLRPAALDPRLMARDLRLTATVGGTFARPLVGYAVTAPALRWGRTGFENVRASGSVEAGTRPLVVPVVATAARVVDVGAELAPLLADLRISGPLTLASGRLAADALAVRTARLAGVATLRLDARGYDIGFAGRLPRYRIGTIGVADVDFRLRALPDATATATRITGGIRAATTRLDSGLLRTLFAGLPVLTTAIDVAPDRSMRFTGLRVAGPGLTLAGGGTRAPDGRVRLRGAGTSRRYGAAVVDLAGPLDRPLIDVALARPGSGLADVTGQFVPGAAGWSFAARGVTALGPATARGLIRDAGAVIDVDAAVAGLTARGSLVADAAGLATGRLALAGEGLTGTADLAAAAGRQRADVALAAREARLAAATIGRGTLAARLVFGDAPAIAARFAVADLRTAGVTLAAASGEVSDDAGRGTLQLNATGSAGVPFTAAFGARFDPDRVDVTASATADGRRLALDRPARFDRASDVWRLAPVTLVTPDGRVALAGEVGGGGFKVDARLDALGLSLLTLVDPAYDFGGRASGTIALAVPGDGPATGAAALRVAGLTRAGLAATSLPVDLGVNAALLPTGASARAVVVRGGVTLGRAQAALQLLPGDDLGARLLAAPLFAQARYAGPAQALWPLAGVDALDVRGPVTIALDVGGRLGDPRLSGTVAAAGARVENTALGTVVDGLALDGRFTGSRLDLVRFAGTVGRDGRIAGSGGIDLSAERGFPVDARLALDNAQLLDRDDLRATVTGTLRLQSDRAGGRVSGALAVARGRYRLGRSVGDVAVVPVTERNAALLGRAAPRARGATRWSLDVAATARDLQVSGMGLDSTWRGDLRLTGPATAPRFAGRVRIVRGDYDFAGKRFTVTRGEIRFAGGDPPDPVIDIVAENTAAGFTAQLALTGTALHPEIKFGSTPALPEDEVLSRVLFGASITTLSAPEAVQLAGALASLRAGGRNSVLDPIDAVRKGLRIDRLRILPADVATGRKTAVAAGQYIGRRLYVELSTDAQGYSASAIEVSLSRSLSILSDVATLGGTSVNLRLKKDY